MLECIECQEETTLDELVSHPDIEPESINDFVYCPHCEDCKTFTSDQGKIEF